MNFSSNFNLGKFQRSFFFILDLSSTLFNLFMVAISSSYNKKLFFFKQKQNKYRNEKEKEKKQEKGKSFNCRIFAFKLFSKFLITLQFLFLLLVKSETSCYIFLCDDDDNKMMIQNINEKGVVL
jgi:hypothetical protein